MKLPDRFSTAVDQLHEEACKATRLADFGDDSYLEGLQTLLHAYDETARFGEIGRYASFASLVNCLKGRLHKQQGIKQHPGCLDNPIRQPVFIIGLPRTGTTILHRLLAQLPQNQGLEYWLGSYPMPRPHRKDWSHCATYQEVKLSLDMLDEINPEIKAIHEMTAQGIDECRLLLMHCFANVTFQSSARVPDYEAWLYLADFVPVYEYYYEALQLIGSTSPEKRWILKDPSHMWALDTLLDVFPDALIVQTHRAPEQLIPSVSSLVYSARKMQEPDVCAAEVGQQQLAQWAQVLNAGTEARRSRPGNFMDVYFTDFVENPLSVVEAIYQRLDSPLDTTQVTALAMWLKQNPQGKHGEHRYTAGDFGLCEADIQRQFSDYKNCYDL